MLKGKKSQIKVKKRTKGDSVKKGCKKGEVGKKNKDIGIQTLLKKIMFLLRGLDMRRVLRLVLKFRKK